MIVNAGDTKVKLTWTQFKHSFAAFNSIKALLFTTVKDYQKYKMLNQNKTTFVEESTIILETSK